MFCVARESLEQARQVAHKYSLLNELRIVNCLLGEVKAAQTFDDFAAELVQIATTATHTAH